MEFLTVVLFAGALLLNAGTPGPCITALVSRVIAKGWRDVLPFATAMWVGEVIWLAMALNGLSALAQNFQLGFQFLKWLGIAYLCWLAIKMWIQKEEQEDAPSARSLLRQSPLSMFGAGIVLTMGNPKIMVFYLALLPSLIDLSVIHTTEWVVLSCVTFLTLAFIDLSWIFLAQRARGYLQTPRAIRLANRLSALGLGGAAAVIAIRD